ncbi:UDP-3-O-(3-hydroxymyristoyl)glucosamine N-acyltransferase [Halocynthiibacter styelae]|uniref:UDP-3-O-(3-hydroxymyristoyl)glucosamine N-acyltransferase n=1 Tax=Halocynthiibacter styelae TaxID=2761955 RepID=A0A8J7LTY6_9RHOB|nr:UDP-3-O-(3-hydroxymyristoyl)glucosamine N-acyltransferase [Paenihalocynthiibacter styelae]MBI1492352.1 UDP-3-O-(3-hydroxymyristoyl)glucosamine N-acyltransferase [Paenihalocynthiibacter styelae]
MRHTVKDIATALGLEAAGAVSFEITHAAEPVGAAADALALAMNPAYAEGLSQGAAQVAMLWEGADWQALGLKAAIFAPRPRFAMSGLTQMLDHGLDLVPGVHPTAVIDSTAQIGAHAAIGPFVVINAGVVIGENAQIASHASVGRNSTIGDNCLIHPGVRIGANVRIGDRFIAQAGGVIGADGFSFVTPEKSGVEKARESLGDQGDVANEGAGQAWIRIHSLGGVEIGDDVETGGNVTIDSGTIRATRIGRGTKLDNQVHLGHNVQVGEDCLLCGQVGIAGSTKIGNRVVMGGQCGASDNIFIGDDVVAGGASKIFTKVPAGRVILGSPAVKMETQVEINKSLRRLPRALKQLADLKTAFASLQETVSKTDENK